MNSLHSQFDAANHDAPALAPTRRSHVAGSGGKLTANVSLQLDEVRLQLLPKFHLLPVPAQGLLVLLFLTFEAVSAQTFFIESR